MAEYEIYDYFPGTGSADISDTLSLSPNEAIAEEGDINVVTHEYDDGSESAVVLSSSPVVYLVFRWDKITASEAGDIVNLYLNTSKAIGRAKSFKLDHYDGHTYIVKFKSTIKRDFGKYVHKVSVRFKVIDRVNDA